MGQLKDAYYQSKSNGGKKFVPCPLCGEQALDAGFVEYTQIPGSGYGATWCENCRYIEYFAAEVDEHTPLKHPPTYGYKAIYKHSA